PPGVEALHARASPSRPRSFRPRSLVRIVGAGASGAHQSSATRIMSARSGRADNPDQDKGGQEDPVLASLRLGGFNLLLFSAHGARQIVLACLAPWRFKHFSATVGVGTPLGFVGIHQPCWGEARGSLTQG